VVNKFGQAHDIKNLFVSDGSQFTSGAACNPNPDDRFACHAAGGLQSQARCRKGNLTGFKTRRPSPEPDRPLFYSAASRSGPAVARKSGAGAVIFER